MTTLAPERSHTVPAPVLAPHRSGLPLPGDLGPDPEGRLVLPDGGLATRHEDRDGDEDPEHDPLAAVAAGAAMRPGVLTVAASAPIDAIAATMVAHGVHAVAVRPDERLLLGWPSRVVSDRDVVAWVAGGCDASVRAADLARRTLGLVLDDETLEAAAAVMTQLAEEHVLVAGNHALFPDGVLSALDLVAVVAGRDPAAGRTGGGSRPGAGVLTRGAGTSVADVAATLADHRVHAVVVQGLDVDDPTFAIVTALDVVRATRRWNPDLRAADLAAPAVTIGVDDTPFAAAERMVRHGVAHLLAVDAEGRPAGVVSSLDVAAAAVARLAAPASDRDG